MASSASPAPAPTTVPTGPPTKVPIAAPDNASTPESIAKFLIFRFSVEVLSSKKSFLALVSILTIFPV